MLPCCTLLSNYGKLIKYELHYLIGQVYLWDLGVWPGPENQ